MEAHKDSKVLPDLTVRVRVMLERAVSTLHSQWDGHFFLVTISNTRQISFLKEKSRNQLLQLTRLSMYEQPSLCCQNLGSLCTMPNKNIETELLRRRKEWLYYFAWQKGILRLGPQELCPSPWWVKRGYIVRQVYVIRINAVTVFISSSAKFQKGEVAGKIRVCAGQRSI